jgi:hypothetical protein
MPDRLPLWRESGRCDEYLAGMRRIVSNEDIAWWKKRHRIIDMSDAAIFQAVNVNAGHIRYDSCLGTVLVDQAETLIQKLVERRVSDPRFAKGGEYRIEIMREKVQTSESRDSATETVAYEMQLVVR